MALLRHAQVAYKGPWLSMGEKGRRGFVSHWPAMFPASEKEIFASLDGTWVSFPEGDTQNGPNLDGYYYMMLGGFASLRKALTYYIFRPEFPYSCVLLMQRTGKTQTGASR